MKVPFSPPDMTEIEAQKVRETILSKSCENSGICLR